MYYVQLLRCESILIYVIRIGLNVSKNSKNNARHLQGEGYEKLKAFG